MPLSNTWWRSFLCCATLVLPSALAAQSIQLEMPIECEVGRSCFIQNYVDHDASSGARDYQCGTLTYDRHNGTDFRLVTTAAQRASVNVLAAASGEILRMRDGVADSLVASAEAVKSNLACGNGIIISHTDGWETQYCHLALGSLRVKPGDRVAVGQPIALVGLSGLTQFPHLHITVRHRGQVVDPFAFEARDGACGGGTSLWSPSARARLAYRERAVLNVGFASGPVKTEEIESGDAGRHAPGRDSDALVAFVRSMGLRARDEQMLLIKGPDGQVVAGRKDKPLERSKAQSIIFIGKKRPETGWPAGRYHASYVVVSDGKIVLESTFALALNDPDIDGQSEAMRIEEHPND